MAYWVKVIASKPDDLPELSCGLHWVEGKNWLLQLFPQFLVQTLDIIHINIYL